MLLDILVLILLVLALFKGFRNGLVVALFSFLAIIIGLAAAIKLSALAAEYIGTSVNIPQRWLPVVAFAVVFTGVALLVRLGARAIEVALRIAMLGWINRLGGILFYVLLYLFVFSILLFYAGQLQLITPQAAEASVTYKYIQPLGPKVIQGLAAVLPFFKGMFADLEAFFEGVSNSAPRAT